MSQEPEEPREDESGTAEGPSLDPAQLEYLRSRLLSEQNLAAAVIGGAIASLVGAAAWAGVTVATGYQIGFMAIAIGFFVGFAVRLLGKRIDPTFGVIGAVLSLLGCALGNLLAVTAIAAAHEGVTFYEAVSMLDPHLAYELMKAFFSPMDLVFYAIAVYEGYKLSFRQVTQDELSEMLSGGVTPGLP
jgi:hypothetical protein